MRDIKNKFDFPPILNVCIRQGLDPYNLKTKRLREERNVITVYFEGEE